MSTRQIQGDGGWSGGVVVETRYQRQKVKRELQKARSRGHTSGSVLYQWRQGEALGFRNPWNFIALSEGEL